MRSTAVHFSALLCSIAFAVAFAPSIGCSDGSNEKSSPKDTADQTPPDAPNETSRAYTDDTSPPAQFRGSPLCQVTTGCMPDDETPSCENHVENGADAATAELKCRIQVGKSECVSGMDRAGVDGVACERGTECAPGFECVDSDRGGVCRRYCCSANSCSEQVSMSGGPTFCDIQRMVDDSSHLAPVCMPLKKCKLLHDGDCSTNETCGIVTDKGESGCVPTGNAAVGAPCDDEHCKEQLTCLGSPGDKRCFKVCRTNGTDCGSTETCTTNALFQNPAFGVCQTER